MVLSLYRRMLEYVRPYVPRLLLAMAVMVGVSALSGSTAFLVKPILDDIFIRKDAARLTYIPLLVLAIYVVRGGLEFAQSYLMSGAGQRVVRDIREHLYRHLQSLSLSFYMRHPTGVLMSRVMNDVGLMQASITDADVGVPGPALDGNGKWAFESAIHDEAGIAGVGAPVLFGGEAACSHDRLTPRSRRIDGHPCPDVEIRAGLRITDGRADDAPMLPQ